MHHQWSRHAKQFRDDPQGIKETLIKHFLCKLRARLMSTFT